MKFSVFFALFIGISSAKAELIDVISGVVDLIPSLESAAGGFENYAEANYNVGNAFEGATTCGNGSEQSLSDVSVATNNLAEEIRKFASAFGNNSDSSGQLKLFNGNILQITDGGHAVAEALNTLAEKMNNLAADIDNEKIDKNNLKKVNDSMGAVANSLNLFNIDFTTLKGPSKLVINLATGLTGVDSAVKDATNSLKYFKNAISAALERCGETFMLGAFLDNIILQAEITNKELQITNLE